MKKKDVYNKAKATWGIDAQVTKTVEELAELQKELCKFILDDGNMKNIAEETADVKIMIDQIELMLEIKEEVKAFKKVKINRLSDRLEIENPSYLKNDCNQCQFKRSMTVCNICRQYSHFKKYAE